MTSQEMLAQAVRNYAATIEAVVDDSYDFGVDTDVDELDDADDCDRDEARYDENGNDLSTSYGRLANYFEYVLDVEYRVDAQLRYKGVVITLACGGPGIYLDTRAKEIRGYWGFGDTCEAREYISSYTAAALDEFFEEQFDCLRGCH